MQTRHVALDIAGTAFTETYRIGVFHGIIDYARKHTAWKLLYNVKTFSLVHRYDRYEDLPAIGADGIIFSTRDSDRLAAIRRTNLPAISISSNPGSGLPSVTTDDVEVGRMGARHFLERGFVHFAFVGSTEEPWEVERRQGFELATSTRSHHCHFFRDEKGDPDHDHQIARDLGEWIRQLPKPIAVMCADDGRALHVLEACNDLGIAVPREVAIVGVDNNTVVCDSLLPSLSSVAQNHERVGWEAAALLDRIMHGEEAGPLDLRLPPREVVTRMSSDVIAVDDPALEKALSYIRDHLAENVSVEQVARAAGVSRSLLEKRFRSGLGTTITEVVRDQRLKAALKLMVETPMLIKEIAEATGFRRATYFSNVFREQLGESPRGWRAKHNPHAPVE